MKRIFHPSSTSSIVRFLKGLDFERVVPRLEYEIGGILCCPVEAPKDVGRRKIRLKSIAIERRASDSRDRKV